MVRFSWSVYSNETTFEMFLFYWMCQEWVHECHLMYHFTFPTSFLCTPHCGCTRIVFAPLSPGTQLQGMGRWVDLHALYNSFVNLKVLDGEPIEYLAFLDQVSCMMLSP